MLDSKQGERAAEDTQQMATGQVQSQGTAFQSQDIQAPVQPQSLTGPGTTFTLKANDLHSLSTSQ